MRASKLQWAVLLTAAFCVGCDDGNPFDYVPVSGKLSYEDGTPIPAGGIRLRFYLQDVGPIDGAYPRPGMANVDQSGSFPNATSYNYGDGLTPGKHKVSLDYATDAEGSSQQDGPLKFRRPHHSYILAAMTMVERR